MRAHDGAGRVAHGKLHRFASNGRAGDDADWNVLDHDYLTAGTFGCWQSGIRQSAPTSDGRSGRSCATGAVEDRRTAVLGGR